MSNPALPRASARARLRPTSERKRFKQANTVTTELPIIDRTTVDAHAMVSSDCPTRAEECAASSLASRLCS